MAKSRTKGAVMLFTTPSRRGKTVSKLFLLEPLGLALSEKQIPQIVETIRSVEN
jgi:hypothetical protein